MGHRIKMDDDNKEPGWKDKLEEWWVMNPIVDWIYDHTVKPYRTYKEMLARMFFWAWHMRWSWDFDAHTIYDMILLKLKKLEYVFEKHGHCCWQEPGDEEYFRMEALKEAIAVCDRIANKSDHDYVDGLNEAHDKKWGELETNMLDNPTKEEDKVPAGVIFRSWRKNAKTKEDEEKEREEYRAIMMQHHEAREADKKRLFELLHEHLDGWWD